MKKTLTYQDTFKVKKAADGSVYIEGWANKAVIDRGGDIIPMDAWNLDNYKKNGVMLFNHDSDKPIGKMTDVRATEQGLWIKGKISKSKDPFVSYVRDLVEEGILNAFSVGFDAKDEAKDAAGVNTIKDAELYEVSVVTLPMNQDSLFSLSSKSLKGLEYNAMRGKVLRAKGAWVAAALQDKIYELLKAGELDRPKIEQMVIEKAGIEADVLSKVLAGQVTPIPEPVLAAFSEVLGLDVEELKKLDAGDVEAEHKPAAEGEAAPEPEEEKKAEPDPAEEPVKEEAKAKPAVDVVAVQIPKDAAADEQAAVQWTKENGWSADKVEEKDGLYIMYQVDPSGYGEALAEVDLGDGVMALVGLKKPEAKAEVVPEAGDQTPEIEPIKVEDVSKAADACQECVSKLMPELMKEGKDKEQAAAIAYSKCKDVCGEKKTKEALPTAQPGPVMDGNPMYEQARQTNVLLGTLIEEIRGMSSKLDKLVVTETEEAKPEPAQVQDEQQSAEVAKMLEGAKLKLAELSQRLRKYTD